MGFALRAAIAFVALAQPLADTWSPRPYPGAQFVSTTRIDTPLELKPASADSEAVIAGQSYVRHTYETQFLPNAAVPAWYRDTLFASGWKLIDAAAIDKPRMQPEDVNVSAHLRDEGHNVYLRVTQEPSGRYTVNIADVGGEDWAAQLARECRVRIHSIHFAHDRPIIEEPQSEPTLQKLAELIKSKNTPPVRIEGHMDNIGEEGRVEREKLSLGRARMVVDWLTKHGGVPANKVTAHGMGRSRPMADNDTDLGRALNRRIEVARPDCPTR